MRKTKRNLLSPLNIPQGKCGDWEVKIDTAAPGEKFATANMRCALFGGQEREVVSWPHETRWTYLKEGGGVWMSDLPCEHAQTIDCLKGVRGRVLVGGLGLGLAATILAKKKSVTKITVVEKSPEVIELVARHLGFEPNGVGEYKTHVVEEDLFDYLEAYDGPPYDWAFYDIWQSDGEGTFFSTVCPLYDLSEGKVKHPPRMWNIDVMRGQLFMSLQGRLLCLRPEVMERLKLPNHRDPWERVGDVYHDWAVPFWTWWREEQPDETLAIFQMRRYAQTYGTWGWQEIWRS